MAGLQKNKHEINTKHECTEVCTLSLENDLVDMCCDIVTTGKVCVKVIHLLSVLALSIVHSCVKLTVRAQAATELNMHVQQKYNITKGTLGMCAPLSIQFFSFSCSFGQKSCEIICFPPKLRDQRPLGKFWIRHCQKT